jgi:hypothetical protein
MEAWKKEFDKLFPNRRNEEGVDGIRNRVATVKNGVVSENNSIVCFSYIGFGMDYVISSVQKLRVSKEVAVKYYDWLANTSPYAEAFVTKDATQIIDEAMAIVTADVDGRIVVGGLMAARAISELHRIPQVWYDLTEHGVHPNVAFVYAHILSTDENRKSLFLGVKGNSNHTALSVNSLEEYGTMVGSEGYYLNFMHGIHKKHPPLKEEEYDYVIQSHWNVPNDTKRTTLTLFRNWFRQLELKSVTNNNNPFSKVSKTKQLSYDEAIKAVSSYLIDEYKGEFN